MRTAGLWLVALVVVMTQGSVGWAEPASVMLEKGIFQEETVGDLDQAIKVYTEITEQDEANRRVVAEAWYRLGMCRLKKGDKPGAAKALETVVKLYPEQKGLTAKAQASLETVRPQPTEFDPDLFRAVVKTIDNTMPGVATAIR